MSQAFLVPALDFADTAGTPWNPGTLVPGPLQRFLDEDPTYYGSTVAGFPVFTPEESYTSIAQPRAGRCWLFDGSNDYGEIAGSGGMIAPNMSFGGWFKFAHADFNYALIAKGTNEQWQLFIAGGFITLQCGGSASLSFPTTGVSGWNHWFATVNGTTGKIYRNGAEVVSGPVLAMPSVNTSLVRIGLHTTGVWAFGGSLKDILIDDEAYTAGEVLSLFNTHQIPAGKSPLAFYRCEEEGGTIGYNSLDNSNHLTLTNITQSTFHAADTGVRFSDANERGHTVSGSVIIPRSVTTPSQDVLGDTLGVTGPVAKLATAEVRCVTGDGSAVYVDLGSALIPATADWSMSLWYYHVTNNTTRRCILSQNGASAPETGRLMLWANASGGSGTAGALELQRDGSFITVTAALTSNSWHYITVSRLSNLYTLNCVSTSASSLVNSGTISGDIYAGRNCYLFINNTSAPLHNDGRFSDFQITTGGVTKYFPLQGGPGTSNTNRDVHWVGSDGTSGVISNAIVNGTVSNIWANYCPYARDWCMENGGSHNPNMLSHTEAFHTFPWSVIGSGVSVSTNVATGPSGANTADQLTGIPAGTEGSTSQYVTVTAGVTYTFSVYVKQAASGSASHIRLTSQNTVAWSTGGSTKIALTSSWQRVSVTWVQTGSTTARVFIGNFAVDASIDADCAGNVLVAQAQLEVGSVATPYQANATTPNGAFVPGRIGSNLDAAGNAKTLVAGKHGNPYSRLVPNVWNMPSLVIRGVDSTDKLVPSATYESLTTATDDAFNRIRSDGSDRYFVTPTTLTGDDLTNADAYTT